VSNRKGSAAAASSAGRTGSYRRSYRNAQSLGMADEEDARSTVRRREDGFRVLSSAR
jgi:hypothetical protein